jgi:hypothetical protein
MIKRVIQFFSLMILAGAFTVISANAQNMVVNRIDASVPFEFNVGDKNFPAGDYIFRITEISPESMSMLIENKDGKTVDEVLISNTGESADGDARLVFDSGTGEHFLAKVVTDEKAFSLAGASDRSTK